MIDLRDVKEIGATAAVSMGFVSSTVQRSNRTLLLVNVATTVASVLRQAGLGDHVWIAPDTFDSSG